MAKKNNKTDHVLNLLSNPSEGPPKGKGKPPVEPEKTTVSVVEPAEDTKELSENIKKSLEEEFEASEANIQSEINSLAKGTDVKVVAEDEAEIKAEPEVEVKPIPEAETEPLQAEQSKAELPVASVQISKEEKRADMSIFNLEADSDFEFVSVMEYVLDRHINQYMEKYGNCTCSRCKADTAALALTNLPAKYVVAQKGSLSPLINYYANRYEKQLTVELVKACMQIAKSPRHD